MIFGYAKEGGDGFEDSTRVLGMGRYFNSLIEKLYYESPFRSIVGVFATARIYTVPAWLTNVVYSRSRPRRLAGTLLLASAMLTLRGAAWCLFKVSSLLGRRTPRSKFTQDRVRGELRKQRGERHALHAPR